MCYEQLFIFLEGADDKKFFDKVIIPKIVGYENIDTVEYAKKSSEQISNHIHSIIAMNADYWYLTDLNSSPCIITKKEKVKQSIKNIDSEKIIIVKPEIESWYYAGLSEASFKQLGVTDHTKFNNTDHLIKEQFNQSIPQKYKARMTFMQEILKNYQLEIVTENQTNKSLAYFLKKFLNWY